jgi:hypothetical protein
MALFHVLYFHLQLIRLPEICCVIIFRLSLYPLEIQFLVSPFGAGHINRWVIGSSPHGLHSDDPALGLS